MADNEKGMVIVEATFVFPIMLVILLFLIYMGNAFYIKAQVEAVAEQEALRGAACCSDPLLETIESTGSYPALKDLKTEPYRFIFGGMDDVEEKISKEAKSQVSGNMMSFFKNMFPEVKSANAQFNNYVVYSTFSVDIAYKIQFPIRLLGDNTVYVLDMNAHSEVAVHNTTEFIRNTDMVIDLFEGTGIEKTISSVFEKISSFISSFAGK